MVGRRGYAYLEAVAGVALAVLVSVGALAVLRARAENALHAYEEAVAREIALGRLERLEAEDWAGLVEGRRELDIDAPGAENLDGLRGAIETGRAEAGARPVAVELSWSPSPGRRRSVRVETVAGRVP